VSVVTNLWIQDRKFIECVSDCHLIKKYSDSWKQVFENCVEIFSEKITDFICKNWK
jgi:hypothetical protein